jgi:radical SAM superfamily enzyme YgiQ (UPF0313 family)
MSKCILTKDRTTVAGGGRATKVGLVQINNSFSNQNYFPYSVGILQAYAQKHLTEPDAFEFLLPIYHRLPVDVAVSQLLNADAVFFSMYVWNERISLAIAKRLKELRPEILTVFGGPQVPTRVEGFLRANPFVDLACHGEGERVFVSILEDGMRGKWDMVPSISYLGDDGVLTSHLLAARMKDLTDVPSPYLAGVFDPLMKANPDEHWIAMWETNRGCPFSCTFCDWGSATASKVFTFELERLFRELEWFAEQRVEFIFCADANFGILPRDLDIARHAAATKRKYGYPQALSVQNTKNATSRAYDVQKTLADAGLNKGVTISFQSVDPMTLKSIKRGNISTSGFQELQRRFNSDRIETYSDMILGLPGETYDSFASGVATVIQDGQHNRIQFNNLSILPNAEMGDPEYQKQYGMVMVESKVVNTHGSLTEEDWEIPEMQQLVIATHATPREDWVRTRAYCWWAGLLYFDKILQIPLILLHERCGIDYRHLFEIFSEGNVQGLPTLAEVRRFFLEKARDIQRGGAEYCQSEEWLNIWWPADEYILIKLCVENKLDAFYEEAEQALTRVLDEGTQSAGIEPLLRDAVLLNKSLLKRPFMTEDLDVETSANLWEFYRSVVLGEPIPLENKPCQYHIDRTSNSWFSWDSWFREVVWYGNKKGAYLYANNSVEREIAGHF